MARDNMYRVGYRDGFIVTVTTIVELDHVDASNALCSMRWWSLDLFLLQSPIIVHFYRPQSKGDNTFGLSVCPDLWELRCTPPRGYRPALCTTGLRCAPWCTRGAYFREKWGSPTTLFIFWWVTWNMQKMFVRIWRGTRTYRGHFTVPHIWGTVHIWIPAFWLDDTHMFVTLRSRPRSRSNVWCIVVDIWAWLAESSKSTMTHGNTVQDLCVFVSNHLWLFYYLPRQRSR